MGIGGSFPRDKAAGEWSWTRTFISCRCKECVVLYLHSPNTSSWRGACLSTGTILPFYLYLNMYTYTLSVCKQCTEWSWSYPCVMFSCNTVLPPWSAAAALYSLLFQRCYDLIFYLCSLNECYWFRRCWKRTAVTCFCFRLAMLLN
jgi:hypothetical protein